MNAFTQDHNPSKPVMLAAVTVPPDFQALAKQHRRALHVHCYRMVGSFSEAEDLVQDTLVRAWTAYASYDPATGEVGFRRWLYRIATNACLDFLKSANRKLTASARSFSEVPWLTPYPDRLLDELATPDASPEAAAAAKQTIALGYLAVIQLLPAQQRAVLVLREVLGWSAAETAGALDISVAAANSALQRARETIERHRGDYPTPTAPTAEEREVLAAFIDAHERRDAAASVAMMSKQIRVTMPPLPHCYIGVDQIAPLLVTAFDGESLGDWKLVPAWANHMPAAISYLRRPGETEYRAFKVDVLCVKDGLVEEITTFGVELLDAFGLPRVLGGEAVS
jgi:RNA polymerase sigma-70 factor (TIGR02960 family)